jgi:Polyketide cyclase / dehydrase and lipid transport
VTTLLERTFDVPVSVAEAWAALADVKRWPDWAPHIAAARVTPDGPVTATTAGSFRFRPVGRARFRMIGFDPPRLWTWTGRVMGVPIDYEHASAELTANRARLAWTVRCERVGLRAARLRVRLSAVDRPSVATVRGHARLATSRRLRGKPWRPARCAQASRDRVALASVGVLSCSQDLEGCPAGNGRDMAFREAGRLIAPGSLTNHANRRGRRSDRR